MRKHAGLCRQFYPWILEVNISDSVGGSISEYEEKMPDSAGGMMSEKVNMSDFFLLAV
jgi:hypothetical protein